MGPGEGRLLHCAPALIFLGVGLLAGNCLVWCCRALPLSPSPPPTLIIFICTHTPSLPFSLFSPSFLYAFCILTPLPSLLTKMGKLPGAGASSRCSLFLSSLPPSLPASLSLSLPLLCQHAHSALSVPAFFSPCLTLAAAQGGSCMCICITITTGIYSCIVGCC